MDMAAEPSERSLTRREYDMNINHVVTGSSMGANIIGDYVRESAN
jgi:hypothetical protein